MCAPGDAPAALEIAIESLARTGRLRFRAGGASMMPTLWPGDELHLEACGQAALRAGDIAAFRRDGRLFVHRVVRVEADGVVTQGDALHWEDPFVPSAYVIGRLAAFERRGRLRAVPSTGPIRRAARALLRRSDFATRLAIRWHRATLPVPA